VEGDFGIAGMSIVPWSDALIIEAHDTVGQESGA